MSGARLANILVAGAILLTSPTANAQDGAETVVILHGIARTASSMASVEAALQEQGYKTVSITYPSTDYDLDGISAWLRSHKLDDAFWRNADRVDFVTHSMGGLVARRYLDRYRSAIPPEKLGRVVMLAPPNGGSEIADLLAGFPPYRWYYGPAGLELTSEAQTTAHVAPYYELGVIAGTKEWPYVISAFIVPGAGDGRVSVEKTKLAGMTDHITVNGTHTFIMDRSDTHRHILAFLKNGAFAHDQP